MAVITRKLSELFEEFLRTYQDKGGVHKYRERLAQLAATGDKSVIVDYEDLIQFNTDLGERLLSQPDDSMKEFKMAAYEVLSTESASYAGQIRSTLSVRIRGITDIVPLRKVDTSHLDKMIAVAGMIVRSSELRPLLVDGAFICPNGHVTRVVQDVVTIRRPFKCESCEETRSLELDEKRSSFIDSQILRMQELPEELPPGQLPRFFDVDVVGDIVNTARPGDRVVLTGVVRAEPDLTPGQARTRVFRSKIESNCIEVSGKDPGQIQITKEEELLIKSIANHQDAYRRLVKSMAPAILGLEAVKEAILLLLAGGPQTILPDGTRLRGDINVFLVGDPGVAKSEMLKFAAQVAPRGMFASGKGSTAAGLSAAVIREKNTFMLEAGVVVLADQGIACIDEFDKMKDDDRSALHEQMEQQSYHPSNEILLSSGKIRIGEFVDEAFRESPSKVVAGKDCEVLPLEEASIAYSVDLANGEIVKTRINRVSRHLAPEFFLRIRYTNGRSVLVTPDHPVFVYREDGVATVKAAKLEVGDFAPAPRFIPNSSVPIRLNSQAVMRQSKPISQPETLSLKTARILGYLITEGNFYEGSSVEVDFTNLDRRLLAEMRALMREEFQIEPILRRTEGREAGLRYVSKTLHSWFRLNFPEMVRKARQKRAPAKILAASVPHIHEFMASAFLGDGSVETDAICYRTASSGLAEDYQDLLLKLGIASRIDVDGYNDSFKVYITGDSLDRFFTTLVDPNDPRCAKVKSLVERGRRNNRRHDVLPTSIVGLYRSLLKKFGLPYSGEFWRHSLSGYGINSSVMADRLASIDQKRSEILGLLEKDQSYPLGQLRVKAGWSQDRMAEACGLPRGSIDYAERGGYSPEERRRILEIARSALRREFGSTEIIDHLKSLMKLRFLRIAGIERVDNSGLEKTDWVYDVTVEPSHNFVSAGAILHNTVTIAKGGIYATLNARTAILAAANPILGKYDPYKNLTENITLPIPLLTRFDLIFIIRDTPTAAQDERLATHILEVHRKRGYTDVPPVQFELLKKYLAYAKKVSPVLTIEAEARLKEYYLELRKNVKEGQIGATPRTLESLIRLAGARARLLLRDQVTEDDALTAIALMNRMVEDVLTDTETKTKGDFGVLMGQGVGERGKLSTSMEIFRTLEGPEKKPVELKIFRDELNKSGRFKTEDEIDKMIQRLIKEGIIWENKPGFYRRVQA
jgi:replicative DNA helicase Mcm